jgi:hypothetical protein
MYLFFWSTHVSLTTGLYWYATVVMNTSFFIVNFVFLSVSSGSGVVTSSESLPCAVLCVQPEGTLFNDISWYWLKNIILTEICQQSDVNTNKQAFFLAVLMLSFWDEILNTFWTVVNRLHFNTSLILRRITAEDYCGCQNWSEIRWQRNKKKRFGRPVSERSWMKPGLYFQRFTVQVSFISHNSLVFSRNKRRWHKFKIFSHGYSNCKVIWN